jgi:recombinational DNA repair protein RecR
MHEHYDEKIKYKSLNRKKYDLNITKALLSNAFCGGLGCQDCICVDVELCRIFKDTGRHAEDRIVIPEQYTFGITFLSRK